jgi:UDPglucose 6-dehydrogenase
MLTCKQMKNPKWVFDGRGIVNVAEMEKLGFRVEAIGRAGSRSHLHGVYTPPPSST